MASGSTHADNIAPALLGGITLIRGYDPIDIKQIPYPDDLWCAVVHPHLEIKTAESRKLIPQNGSPGDRPETVREPGRTGGRTELRAIIP